MIRRLRRAVCIVSLALWVATGFLAVRSDRDADVAEWRRVGTIYGACSRSGCLTAYATAYPPGEVTAATGFRWYQTEATGPAEEAQDPAYAEAGIRRSAVKVPYWFVMVCAACLPTWRLASHLVSRRRMLRNRHGGFTIADVSGVSLSAATPCRARQRGRSGHSHHVDFQ